MKISAKFMRPQRLNEWCVWYSGFLYTSTSRAGNETVTALLNQLASQVAPDDLANTLWGNYTICIINSNTNEWWLFCDGSGMAPLFYSNVAASTSILNVIRQSCNLQPKPELFMEFLLTGLYDPDHYPVEGLRRLRGNEILHGTSTHEVSIVTKSKPSFIPRDKFNFIESVKSLSESMSTETIGLDLTAGWDSRLNLAMLHAGSAKIDMSIASLPDHPDAFIARKIAATLNEPFYLTPPRDEKSLTEEILKVSLLAGDGLCSDIELIDRKSRLVVDRKSRNVGVSIDGTGGELYKDFWWLQDFPFYGVSRVDINRLINSRIPMANPGIYGLTATASKMYGIAVTNYSNRLTMQKTGTNITTYDAIYRRRMIGLSGQLSAAIHRQTGMPMYAPLLEDSRVLFARNLPINQRILDRFHRRVISELLPQLDHIPTEKGMYSSDNIAMSVFRYGRSFAKRALSKAWQMSTGRRLHSLPSPGDKSVYLDTILHSETWHRALKILEEQEVIVSGHKFDTDAYIAVTRLMTVALLIGDLNNTPLVNKSPLGELELTEIVP